MLTLGIESSCDETAIAVVQNGNKVLSSIVATQIETHKIYGGVIPEIAAREHLRNIYPLFQKALDKSAISTKHLELIAVTQGPGLIGALLIGVSFAKALGYALNIPVQPVDHVHSHIHGALLGCQTEVTFPALSLVVSGGHTNLYYMSHLTDFQLLASTMDDACGECFDKVAKMLGLDYPGGPQIEKMAREGDPSRIKMPKIMADHTASGFSYSGLKTHMYYLLQKEANLSDQRKKDICAAFQDEAFHQILRKLKIFLPVYKNEIKSVIIAGGVAANKRFRELISTAICDIPVFFPDLTYCSDNAAMVAALGWHLHHNQNSSFSMQWDAYSRYSFEAVTRS